MDRDYKGQPPLDDEAWLEEELKREAGIFHPEKQPDRIVPAAAPTETPTEAPEEAEQEPPSLEQVPLPPDTSAEDLPLPQEEPQPAVPAAAAVPVVPAAWTGPQRPFSREELRRGIKMAIVLGRPKALQKEGDEF